MRFGLRYCNTGRFVDPGLAVELAQAADEAGFESIWTVEHTVVPGGYESAYPYSPDGKVAGGRDDFPLPDPLIWMAFVASQTRRIRFATGILIVPQHNPVTAAKQIATLDHMTGGRLLLGIGEDLSSLRSLADLGVERVLVPVAPMPGMGLHLGRPENAQAVMEQLLEAAPSG